MGKKGKSTLSLRVTAADGAQAAALVDSVVLAAGARPKGCEVLLEKLTQKEKAIILGGTWRSNTVLPLKSMLEAAEVEFPLISSQGFHLPIAMKAKQLAAYDESGEWKYLTAIHSHLVECLREKFDRLEMGNGGPAIFQVISVG